MNANCVRLYIADSYVLNVGGMKKEYALEVNEQALDPLSARVELVWLSPKLQEKVVQSRPVSSKRAHRHARGLCTTGESIPCLLKCSKVALHIPLLPSPVRHLG